ncbi:uncharacterized protein LOC100181901 [Ciona intestinalis]
MEGDEIQRLMRYEESVNPLPELADIFLPNEGFCGIDALQKESDLHNFSIPDCLLQYTQLDHPDATDLVHVAKHVAGNDHTVSVHPSSVQESNPPPSAASVVKSTDYRDKTADVKHKTIQQKLNETKKVLFNSSSSLDTSDCGKSKSSPTIDIKLQDVTDGKVVGVCGVCRFTYSTYKEKQAHMKGSDHICKREALSGTNFKMLADETELLKAVENLPQPCSVCKKPLPSLQEFLVHHRKHSGKIPFVCIRCKSSFAKRSDLIYHIKKHLGVNNFMCSRCPQSFRQQSRLTSHMIAQHGVKDTRPRNFNCTECNESFMTKSAVNMHMQSHTGYRPIICTECGHGFRSNNALAAHQRVHTGEKPFKCDMCTFSTKTKQLLSRHIRKHTGEKPYKCEHCTFSTACSAGLKRHILQHTGSKPFRCPYCSYRSSNIENLRKHIKSTTKHTGLKIYPCHHCDFSCDQGSDYLKHMKQHFPYLDVDSESATKLAGILVSEQNDELEKSPAQPHTAYTNSELPISSCKDEDVEMMVTTMKEDQNKTRGETGNLAELDAEFLNALIKIPNLQRIILPQDSSNGPVTLVIGSDQPINEVFQEDTNNSNEVLSPTNKVQSTGFQKPYHLSATTLNGLSSATNEADHFLLPNETSSCV